MSSLPITDAHQHFWDLSKQRHPWLRAEPPHPFRYGDSRPLRRNYMPEDYRADFTGGDFTGGGSPGHDVVKSVYVEAEWDPRDPIGETRWVHQVAEAHGFPHAMVAQAWLDREDAAQVLAAQAAFPLVRGIRHKPATQPADRPPAVDSPEPSTHPRAPLPGSMGDPAWRAGYALLERHGLSFDLQTPWRHLVEAAQLARDFPRTLLILNHTGLPADRSPEGLAGWRQALETLAGQPNTAVKISGLGLPGQPWSAEANRRIVLDAIAIFGVERAMFASNFPVDGLVGRFDTIFSGFKEITAHLPRAQREALFHGNALRHYRIEE